MAWVMHHLVFHRKHAINPENITSAQYYYMYVCIIDIYVYDT